MRPPCRPQPAPTCTDELLLLLRSARLLDEAALARLSVAWASGGEVGQRLDELVRAGLLTPFQAEQVRLGRTRRLRLGPYRLVERLGTAVYRAEHALLGRTVVLKVLSRKGAEGPTFAQREVRAAGQLSHPNLVAAHDARRIRGRLVLVLEHVEGADLAHTLIQCGPLPFDLVRAVARQALAALDHLHRRGLVHRDVKPANLLLTHGPNGDPRVKLLDLGLVCPAAARGEALCGTPDYLPPERGVDPEALDVRGDLYSLGCTLYELLVGRVPFPGGTWTGKLLRHRIEEPTPAAELRPGLPPDLDALVVRLMQRDPDRRPTTPLDAARLLEVPMATLAEPPPAAPPRRHLCPLACLAAVAVGVAFGCLARALPPLSVVLPPATKVIGKPVAPFDLRTALADATVVELPDGDHAVGPLHVRPGTTLRAAPAPGRASWSGATRTVGTR